MQISGPGGRVVQCDEVNRWSQPSLFRSYNPTKRICLEKRYLSSAERAKKVFMTALIVACFETTCITDSGCFASSDHLVVAVVISR